jgi:integrase
MAWLQGAGGPPMSQQGTMVGKAREYLRHRRSLGFALEASEYVLLDFARFADQLRHRGPLTTSLMLRWATGVKSHSDRYRAERLSIVRGFARHLASMDGRSQVPDTRLLANPHRRVQPHIFTEKQLADLVAAAAKLKADYALRPHTYASLFGLLASTGLRVSEALELRRADVDLRSGILLVWQTKFRKSRWVPMHPTVTRAMRQFAARRDSDADLRSSVWFFGHRGRPLPYTTVLGTFRRLCSQLGWRSNGALPRPRIHDMRHSFACRRLLQWYRDGVDIDQAIASLSTYLGHAKVTDTYWYMSGTGELLSIAGERFEKFAATAEGRP